ncbi:MAG: hypothetical protein H0Z24_05040 [Thermosipho sp. (in: Bacteria)]|nr:hypothetical protein [Thermosipho sp. (in: thermotogales)]
MLIDLLLIFIFFATFLNFNIYFFIFFGAALLAYYFKSMKWLYFIVFLALLFFYKNPIPLILMYAYEKTKKENNEIYTFLIYFMFSAVFYSLKVLLFSLILLILLALYERKLIYIIFIPLMFVPMLFSPFSYISNYEQSLQTSTSFNIPIDSSNEEQYNGEHVYNEGNGGNQDNKIAFKDEILMDEKYDTIIFSLLFILGVLSLILLLKFTTRPTLKITLGILIVVVISYLLFLVIFPYFAKDMKVKFNESIFEQTYNELNIEKVPLSTSTTSNTNASTVKKTTDISKIGIVLIVLVAIVLVGVVVYLTWNLNEGKLEKSKTKDNKKWETNDTVEDIMELSSDDLVRRAYIYLRAKVFSGYFYLTPYELSKIVDILDFTYLTKLYVEIEYGQKQLKYDEERIKKIFKNIVENKITV